MTVQPNKTYESLVRYIAQMMRECGIRLLFFSAGMHFDKQIKENKSLCGYCQSIPIQCSHRDFLLNQQKGADDKYGCGANLKMLYRRDRQAYCLYRRRHSRRPTNSLSGRTPNPIPFLYEKKRYAKRNEINASKMSNILQKERITKTNKTKMVAMRFRESDYAAIKRKAEKANMNFTEFVTAAALNKPITVINGLSDVLKEQKAIGRNLNQLTTLCNMGKIVCPDLTELIRQYGEVYGKISELSGRCG